MSNVNNSFRASQLLPSTGIMPRKYIRKSDKQLDRTNLEAAFKHRVVMKCSMKEAANEFGVKKTTLVDAFNRSKKLSDGMTYVPVQPHSSRVFTPQQELRIVDYTIQAAKMFYGLSMNEVRRMVYQYALACGSKTIPDAWEKDKMATRDWYYLFMDRYPNLVLKGPEASISSGIPVETSARLRNRDCQIFVNTKGVTEDDGATEVSASKMESESSDVTSDEDSSISTDTEESAGFEFIYVKKDHLPEGKESRIYRYRFLKEWKKLPEFQGWLREGSISEKAHCTTCNKEMVAVKSKLLQHASGKKHKRMVAKQQSGITSRPELSSVLDDLSFKDFLEHYGRAGQLTTKSLRMPSLSDKKQSPNHRPSQKLPRKERNSRKVNEIMSLMQQELDAICPEDKFDAFGKSLAIQLRKLENDVKVHAEKLIYDILYEAELGNVNQGTQIAQFDNSATH